jgi:hypothetical protein
MEVACKRTPRDEYHPEVREIPSRKLAGTIHHWLQGAAPVQSERVDAPACGGVIMPQGIELHAAVQLLSVCRLGWWVDVLALVIFLAFRRF